MTNPKIKETSRLIQGHTKNLEDAYVLLIFIDDELDKLELKDSEMGFSAMKTQIEFHCFLTSSLLDLLSITKGLLVSDESWQKIFYLKNAYLTIYETVKTFNSHNVNFKFIVAQEYSHLLEEYKEITLSLRVFKKEYNFDSGISKIRNSISGHSDKDFNVYYENILSLKSKKNIKAINDFMDIVYKLMKFSYDIAMESEKKTKFKTVTVEQNFIVKLKEFKSIINYQNGKNNWC